ncbi:Hypothetical predicted protein [Pelobates cultripes]|uniref:Interleukin family protein n=1 Tax=Pelobates cultripes TaxID=61616 RepID=A0AAD1R112_PELCU|nr:Hypothetical predicted protein [Pelobates cultripes]
MFDYIALNLICCLLIKLPSTVASERKNLCPVFAEFYEFKRHFEAIKDVLHNEDLITDISLLKANTLNNIHASEHCCFLLKIGQFYLANVFPNVSDRSKTLQRHFSHLANSVLGLKIELKHCQSTMRCPCGMYSHQIVEDMKAEFYKLDMEAASLKAVGELNILFSWMERHFLI